MKNACEVIKIKQMLTYFKRIDTDVFFRRGTGAMKNRKIMIAGMLICAIVRRVRDGFTARRRDGRDGARDEGELSSITYR